MKNQHPATFLRTRYNYDTDRASLDSGLECKDLSLAVQSQKHEADINEIVRKFGLTGTMPINPRVPQYGDFTGVGDYKSCLQAVMDAEAEFMRLPANIRARQACCD